jgi:hypothetical protein
MSRIRTRAAATAAVIGIAAAPVGIAKAGQHPHGDQHLIHDHTMAQEQLAARPPRSASRRPRRT